MSGIRTRNGGRGGRGDSVRKALSGLARAIADRFMRWRGRPPKLVGVREPRRPKPTLPAAAVALAEPKTGVRRWIRLGSARVNRA